MIGYLVCVLVAFGIVSVYLIHTYRMERDRQKEQTEKDIGY